MLTSCSLILNLPSQRVANTHRTHLPIPFPSLGTHTRQLYGLSAGVQRRPNTCLQRTNEQDNLGDLGVMHKVHLWLDGKRIVDFLLVIIELFSLALTAKALLSEICQNQRFLRGW